ncbi:MAG: thioredoxin family protein [Bacteroidota bacterium]|nr:thioredoxin family protein [Bacteroidota bacterium]MDE2833361.1 thioredoxin family protein [Bacteroidota bacterium]MDE2957391.1 thioredoxin family protein [Bacteroidota bacterium]
MALTYSRMTNLGDAAPAFDLPVSNPDADGLEGSTRSLVQLADGKPLVVIFMCNHCPFVVHIEDAVVEVARTWLSKGVQFVGISSNDARQYPADSFENMARRAAEKRYPFPYLYDESQEIAVAYGAECTPDIFVYDSYLKLAYRGRFDGTRPGQGHPDGQDLVQALEELTTDGFVSMLQHPSMGCNIKWR